MRDRSESDTNQEEGDTYSVTEDDIGEDTSGLDRADFDEPLKL